MSETTPFGSFFFPGPTEVRAEVLAAMARPMISHRGSEFMALFARIQEGLKTVFGTTRPVYVGTCSATGFMEAAVRCAPAGPILSLVNGGFSQRFADIARACGRETDVVEVPWGGVVPLDAAEAKLAAGRYAAVTVVHSESSTGVLTDVAAVAALAHRHGALCLVDSVTGIGGAPLRTDEAGVDFVLTGSQKALALPPGLAFAVASEKYIDSTADAPGRGHYFDVTEYEKFAEKNQTPTTPATSLIFALDVQLAAICHEGMERRWARHAAMADRTARWVEEMAGRTAAELSVLAPAGARSPTVTAITLPSGLSATEVAKATRARGIVVGSGYGKLKDATFRIGHMGDHTLAGLERCLAVCEDVLRAL